MFRIGVYGNFGHYGHKHMWPLRSVARPRQATGGHRGRGTNGWIMSVAKLVVWPYRLLL